MIVSTTSQTGSLLVLSKDHPQAATHKRLHPLKGARMSMLEIIKPTAKRRIQLGNNRGQTISARALGPHPNAISKRCAALFPYPASPHFEAIAQKLKALPVLPTVTHMGLFDVKTEPVLFHPASHFFKRGLRLFGPVAKHHKVIGVANHAVAFWLHVTVQRMKIDVGQQRTNHRSLRRAARWRPSLHLSDKVLLKKCFDQLKHPPLAHPFLHALQKLFVGDGVEVALKISIHHKGVALFKQPIHFSKRVFAATPRAKTVAHLKELPLKDRLQHKLKRRLNDAVFDRRYSQGTKFSTPLGHLHSSYGLWSVASLLKSRTQLLKIHLRPHRKPLHTLSVHSRSSPVCLDPLPCRPKRLGSVHFIDQAEPFTSLDAVLQRRQHAFVPHRSFHPRPVAAVCLCALCSLLRHYRRLAFALLHCETHTSTFLSPFPRRGFAFRTSRDFRRFGTMETLTPAPLTTPSAGLPAYLTTPSCRSISNHVGCLDIATTTPACPAIFGLHHA